MLQSKNNQTKSNGKSSDTLHLGQHENTIMCIYFCSRGNYEDFERIKRNVLRNGDFSLHSEHS